MQLTLRVLLDYLDDTLEPAQTRQIGLQIAEDTEIQELIARIKQVTRRRRLTVPPAGGNHPRFDAHIVASYLDGSLPDEEAGVLEKICLESDVHLAELASCHQILTLSMGEPALVPPTATERMYRLVKGKETAPNRRPALQKRRRLPEEEPWPDNAHADTASALGLPAINSQAPWVRWALPLGAAVLLLGVGTLLYIKLSDMFHGTQNRQARFNPAGTYRDSGSLDRGDPRAGKSSSVGNNSSSELRGSGSGSAGGSTGGSTGGVKGGGSGGLSSGSSSSSGSGAAAGGSSSSAQGSSSSTGGVKEWFGEPSNKQIKVGKVGQPVQALPSLLVRRKADTTEEEPNRPWERVPPQAPIRTADTLMALPGFRTDLNLDRGVDLQLWGSIPVFFLPVPLLEAAVILHDNPDCELDLTLLRGRIVLTNKEKRQVHVLVRFYNEKERKEIWDICLHENAEVGLEKIEEPNYKEEFDPDRKTHLPPSNYLTLVALRGEADVQVDEFRKVRVQGGAAAQAGTPQFPFLFWNNATTTSSSLRAEQDPDMLKLWDRTLPATKEATGMKAALDNFDQHFTNKSLSLVARETAEDKSREKAILGLHCLGAVDSLGEIVVALGDSRLEKCDAAWMTLRCWMSRTGDNEMKLYNSLLERNITKTDATIMMQLLHGISERQYGDPKTWSRLIGYLAHPKSAICYLAYRQLYLFVPEGQKIAYQPTGETAQKEDAIRRWKEIIPDGKLPPRTQK